MPIELIAPLIVAVVDSAITTGGLAAWCSSHNDPGCVHHKKRDDTIVDTSGVPSLTGLFRRQDGVGPCGVPQYNFDLCHEQLQGVTVQTSIPADSGKQIIHIYGELLANEVTPFFSFSTEGQFDNVPAACMDLAAVLSGDCTDTTVRPTVCGSACLHYTGLTNGNYANISNALTS
ncbi:hypothetical protein PG993_011646 [Apiospora rasikravindrae]|uniref:Secreted protein n=1 Tax=Apiospora rasikravindrae TaxID=990691 RepID=A0ABR1S076_9PEZI